MTCSTSEVINEPFVGPQANQVEVVLIGPGYGECILVHVGDDKWIVVDSCFFDRKPAPLHYLRAIGREPSAVKVMAVTHWHDDHIRGMGAVFNAASGADLFAPAAMGSREFVDLAMAYERAVLTSSGISELAGILGSDPARVRWALENTRIFSDRTSAGDVEVWALSPSALEFATSQAKFAAMAPRALKPINRLPSTGPNHLAMVLWVRVGEVNLLLGSDLEEPDVRGRGWTAVADLPGRPQGLASLYKVAHHGSDTAFSGRIWTELLSANPVAITSPFVRGRSRLPTAAAVEELKRFTDHLFLTTKHALVRAARKAAIVEDEISAVASGPMMQEPSEPGIIRCRFDLGSAPHSWTVGLKPSAHRV